MTRWHTLRRRLLAPLVYLAALFLLLEDWLWDCGVRLTAGLARWQGLRRLERRIAMLPPGAALALFLLPVLLLLPVKLAALYAMACGHALAGLAVIVLAKLCSAAIVARIYVLTRPALLTMAWFARLETWFLALKERAIARLQATPTWRRLRHLTAALRRGWRRWQGPGRTRWPGPCQRRGRAAPRLRRVLRRLAALWRARRD